MYYCDVAIESNVLHTAIKDFRLDSKVAQQQFIVTTAPAKRY